jgi:F0F1-type ATP synthase assembly protein I
MADSPRRFSRYLRFSSLGLELGGSVIVGLFVGQWLDRKMPQWTDGKIHTEPWLLLLFLGFGMAAGFRSVLRLLRDQSKPSEPPQESGKP